LRIASHGPPPPASASNRQQPPATAKRQPTTVRPGGPRRATCAGSAHRAGVEDLFADTNMLLTSPSTSYVRSIDQLRPHRTARIRTRPPGADPALSSGDPLTTSAIACSPARLLACSPAHLLTCTSVSVFSSVIFRPAPSSPSSECVAIDVTVSRTRSRRRTAEAVRATGSTGAAPSNTLVTLRDIGASRRDGSTERAIHPQPVDNILPRQPPRP
jgi:hypothetical protein